MGMLAAAALPAVAAADDAPTSAVVATVAGRSITVGELQQEMLRRAGSGATFATPQARQALLDELIRIELLAAEARRTGYAERPDVAAAMRRLLVETFDRERRQALDKEAVVSDADVEAYYRAHPDEFGAGTRARVALVRIEGRGGDDTARQADLKERARKAAEAARGVPAAQGFGPAAHQLSADVASRMNGGDVGWLRAGESYRWPDEVTRAVLDLAKAGDVTGPIETKDGTWMGRLVERRTEPALAFERVRATVRQRLEQDARKSRLARADEALRAKNGVQIKNDVLTALRPPAGMPAPDNAPPPLPRP